MILGEIIQAVQEIIQRPDEVLVIEMVLQSEITQIGQVELEGVPAGLSHLFTGAPEIIQEWDSLHRTTISEGLILNQQEGFLPTM